MEYTAHTISNIYELSRHSWGRSTAPDYLAGGADAVNRLRNITYQALETLGQGSHAWDTPLNVEIPSDLQKDASILYTCSLRKDTMFERPGAPLTLTKTQIECMNIFLQDGACKTSLLKHDEESLKIFLDTIVNIPDMMTNDKGLIELGVAKSPIPAQNLVDSPSHLADIVHVWNKCLFALSDRSTNTVYAELLTDDQQDHMKSQGLFGGQLQAPNKTGAWDMIVEGIPTAEERVKVITLKAMEKLGGYGLQ